jgi:hypothetical protein
MSRNEIKCERLRPRIRRRFPSTRKTNGRRVVCFSCNAHHQCKLRPDGTINRGLYLLGENKILQQQNASRAPGKATRFCRRTKNEPARKIFRRRSKRKNGSAEFLAEHSTADAKTETANLGSRHRAAETTAGCKPRSRYGGKALVAQTKNLGGTCSAANAAQTRIRNWLARQTHGQKNRDLALR